MGLDFLQGDSNERSPTSKDDYLDVLEEISKAVHPFTLEGSQQTSEQVENALNEQALKLQKIAGNNMTSDSQGALNKFKHQVKDIACVVGAWWVWAEESLVTFNLDSGLRDWLLYTLLLVIYWYNQMEKTQNPDLKMAYKKAWMQALDTWQTDPIAQNFSSEEMERWKAWAEWMVSKFQRTSSAVEGRNGWLSQMYHNGRGFTIQRLKALTVIHNFGLPRKAGQLVKPTG